MTLISLNNVEYAYPARSEEPVIESFSMIIDRGDVIRIVGRNGSGKSTLLKIIADLLSPTCGERKSANGIRVVYLNQNAYEFTAPDLLVNEQVQVGVGAARREKRLPKSQVEGLNRRLTALLKSYELGFGEGKEFFVGQLSGGQRQVVALISTIASGAQVLCLDEFTASMDKETESKSVEVLHELLKQGEILSLLYVNHAGSLEIESSTIVLEST